MKVGFIGLGRMGSGMANRLLEAGIDLVVFDLLPVQTQALAAAGASVAATAAEAITGRDVVINMLPHDAALRSLTFGAGGVLERLDSGAIHMPMGTHGVPVMRELNAAHAGAGQVLVAAHVLGRPDLAASGELGIVPAGPAGAVSSLMPVFEVLGKQVFVAGTDPQAATAVKIANNFVLGCAIETIGEAMALVRKLGVEPELFYEVMTKGLFSAPAYEVYGRIITDQAYDTVGATATIGLKDANLALEAAEAADMPLPSANVLRDRLLGAIAHGDADRDWAVVAREQARASGLED